LSLGHAFEIGEVGRIDGCDGHPIVGASVPARSVRYEVRDEFLGGGEDTLANAPGSEWNADKPKAVGRLARGLCARYLLGRPELSDNQPFGLM
jgi:hypothetical protein